MAYDNLLDNSVLPTLWQLFDEGSFLYQHDNARSTVVGGSVCGLMRWVLKNLTRLHRALIATPLNTFEKCTSSVTDLTNALAKEWKAIPAAMYHNLVKSLPS